MSGMIRREHSSGFTLVELLVVVAIIGILVAFGAVSLRYSLETAKDTQSAANLRQIGVALNLYASDNQGRYPIARAVRTLENVVETNENTWPWPYQLREFLDPENKVYHCPNVPDMQYGYYLGVRAAFLEARAAGITPPFTPVHQLRITDPSHHILAGEALYWAAPANNADKDDGISRPSFREDDEPGEKTPILFVDGRVEFFRQFDSNLMTANYEGLGSPYRATMPKPGKPKRPPGGGPPRGGRPRP